jgi:GNAT superfamily N-acetyltransferase
MNLENYRTLTIRVVDFNLVAEQPETLKQLRKLTLGLSSGLNHELTTLLAINKKRPALAMVLLAYRKDKLVGWALLSQENSTYWFPKLPHGYFYAKTHGILIEMYIHPDHRRQGIGTEIMKVARRKAGKTRLCVVPWDPTSHKFYEKFEHYNVRKI